MKYRNKPVVIDAIQWTELNIEEVKNFVGENLHYGVINTKDRDGNCKQYINMIIETPEGNFVCTKGDYIVKGVNGEFCLYKPDVFKKTYEAV